MTTSTEDNGTAGHNPAASRPGRDRDRLLIDIGQEIRAMRTELGVASEKFDRVVTDVSEVIGPDVAELRAQVATLRGEVDALLEEHGGGEDEDERPLDWHELTAEQAAEAWTELHKWLQVQLVFNFEVKRGQLPDCWALHRPAVRHLWALYLVYGAAHDGPRASPVNVIEWNTRWLDTVLDKIREAIPDTMCRPVAGGPGSHHVPKQDFERQRQAASKGLDPRAGLAGLRERAAALKEPVEADEPSIPPYANPAARSATRGAAAPAEPPAWTGVAAEQEVTDPKYWSEFYGQAVAADLQWRRHRDEAAAAEAAGDSART